MQETEILTQQSTTAVNIEGGDDMEEELLDYDEDPLVAEKLAMAEIEKRVEQRATKLINDAAINIHSEKGAAGEKVGSGSNNTSEGTEGEEIDWDKIQVALDSNKEIDPEEVTKKKSGGEKLRRSIRHANDNCKIQDKAEAAKKKQNELPGNLSSFVVFNSVSTSTLENLATVSNIKLGSSSDEIATVLDSIQAKELAKATLLATKIRVAEQEKRGKVESEAINHTSTQAEMSVCSEGGKSDQRQSVAHELSEASKAHDTDRSNGKNYKRQKETENENIESELEEEDFDVEKLEEPGRRGRQRNRPPKKPPKGKTGTNEETERRGGRTKRNPR
jgi:hypothetical protein